MTFLSYSQNLEDVMLWRALRHVESGFYVDVGAWDPRVDSVTLAFSERGWHGINVEPNPEHAAALRAARPRDVTVECAVSDHEGTRTFHDIAMTGLSTLEPEIAARHQASGHAMTERVVPVQTLAQICAAHAEPVIHFLKIDVEGHEPAVLSGMDFERFRPWIVVVEATEPNAPTPTFEAFEHLLTRAGYAVVYWDGLNRFYVAHEHQAALGPAFALPPNVFDDYVSDAAIRGALHVRQAGRPLDTSLEPVFGQLQQAEAAGEAAAAAAAAQAAEAARALQAEAAVRAGTEARAAVLESDLRTAQAGRGAAERAVWAEAAVRAEAEARAAALAADLRAAEAGRSVAERAALAARREAALAWADAEAEAATTPGEAGAFRAESVPEAPSAPPAAAQARRQRVYYDASLIIAFGHETPVGLVRTEHYLAEYLVRSPDMAVMFVQFDRERRVYRALTRAEARLVRTILFHRYDTDSRSPDVLWDERMPPADDDDEEEEPAGPISVAQWPDPSMLPDLSPIRPAPEPVPDPPAAAAEEPISVADDVPVTPGLLLRRARTAAMLPGIHFQTMMDQYGQALLPVRPGHSLPRRLLTRSTRGAAVVAGRVLHGVLRPLTWSLGAGAQGVRQLARPDVHPHVREEPPSLPAPPLEPEPPPPPEPEPEPPRARPKPRPIPLPGELRVPHFEEDARPGPPPGAIRFARGSVLVSAGNSWDYLDYDYLYRTCRDRGVRFIALIYDVIAMDLPFSTPSRPDIYQRHWVEIGHCADRLLAISRFTVAQYEEFVAAPNDIATPVSHAYLPNFLLDRAAEIGEVPVPPLAGKRFVVYCSTIETRKNHQLLVHLWDRLRKVVPAEQLPVLVFAGKWGWGTETVRLLTERNYRLRDHIKVLDRISDAELIWVYRHAAFTVFPSLSEGYGLAAAESLSFGTPAVVADCPALIEATEGLMPAFDPLDIAAWYRELLALITDDSRLEALRTAAGRYRGPGYDDFAAALCALALHPAEAAQEQRP